MEKIEEYKKMNIEDVRKKAKQGDKDALFAMAYRRPDDEEAPPLVWQAYWLDKAAAKGHIRAMRIYADIFAEITLPAKNCERLELYDKLAKEYRKTGDDNGEAFVKIESGIILCEGLGLGNLRDHKKGVQLIKEAEELGKKVIFPQLFRLGTLYAMGYTQEDEAPLEEDLKQAIKYLNEAINEFDSNYDEEWMLEDAIKLRDIQKEHLSVWKKDTEEYNRRVAKERREKFEQPTEVGRQFEDFMRRLRERLAHLWLEEAQKANVVKNFISEKMALDLLSKLQQYNHALGNN